MPTLLEQRATELQVAHDIIKAAGGRTLTKDEHDTLAAQEQKIIGIDADIARTKADKDLMDRIGAMTPSHDDDADQKAAKSIGEHFVKNAMGLTLKDLKDRVRGSMSSQPWSAKAATDTTVTGSVWEDALTDRDNEIVKQYRDQPFLVDLLGTTPISGTSIKYHVMHPTRVEGGFAPVAEAGLKPQMHWLDPTPTTDELRKIAGRWKISDEMLEDLPYVVNEINTDGLYYLAMEEEDQLLNGDGTGQSLLGLRNRSGLQTHAIGTDTRADAIFKAATKVRTATGLTADGLAMNPADYEMLRLTKDANGQYVGGGFFAGQYGVGAQPGVYQVLPVWGLRTVLTDALPVGTYMVGAFRMAAKVFRKGGIRVEATNSNENDFNYNLVSFRMEERVGLQVKRPAAIVEGALA